MCGARNLSQAMVDHYVIDHARARESKRREREMYLRLALYALLFLSVLLSCIAVDIALS